MEASTKTDRSVCSYCFISNLLFVDTALAHLLFIWRNFCEEHKILARKATSKVLAVYGNTALDNFNQIIVHNLNGSR